MTTAENQAAVRERAARGRTRRYQGDSTRALDPEENLRVQSARDHVLASPKPGEVVLFHPLYPGLRFGPGEGHAPGVFEDHLVFGPEPHVLKVPLDHPLLLDLLRKHPAIEVVMELMDPATTADPSFMDPFTGTEFGSQEALAEHMAATYNISPPKIRAVQKKLGGGADSQED